MAVHHWDSAPETASWRAALAFLAEPLIAGQPYVHRGESDLHWTLGGVLQDAGIPLHHEARLAPGVRIDFTSGRVGIEIKTAGGASDVNTEKQLVRYSRTGAIRAILVITTVSRHLRAPTSRVYGVPVAVLHISAVRDRSFEARYRIF